MKLKKSDAPVQLLLSDDEANRLKALDKEITALLDDICKRRGLSKPRCFASLYHGDPLLDIRNGIISVEMAMIEPRELRMIEF